MCENNKYDCVILDIMMPVLDGFAACKKIKENKDVAIIMLSARQEEDDKLFCFNLGVDDYVVKPFSPKELMARIKAVCDRHKKQENIVYKFGDLNIDVSGRVVKNGSEKLIMTPKEIDLLIYLVENKGVAMDRQRILNAVWDMDYYGDDRTVDTHIKMLRRSLGEYRDLIVTVRGMGYKFED